MAGELFLHDSYAQEMRVSVLEALPDGVVLGNTTFYPSGGGQPGDTGRLVKLPDEIEYRVTDTVKRDGKIVHVLGEHDLQEHDVVAGWIDWDRRYKHMRYHTAAHILSAVVHSKAGALITGNQIRDDKLRIDFSLDEYDPAAFTHYVEEANRIIAMHLDVHVRFLPRDEALALPGVVKLAGALPPNLALLRIVTIGSRDTFLADEQADGGTHVHNTRELAPLEIVSMENKGKANRRLTVRFTDEKNAE